MKQTGKDMAGAKERLDRRGFLKVLGLGSAATAVAVVPAAVEEAQALDPGTDEKRARYRESDHVKKYYATNRY